LTAGKWYNKSIEKTMNESLKKMSAEIAAEIAAFVASDETKSFIAKTKEATPEDSGTFEVIISTADTDRQGEIVDQNGWDLANYKVNPVVLFGHDYYSLPIGICDEITLDGGKLIAKGRFAPADANPFAQQVRKLYDLKIMRATSVGFIVKEALGNVITKAELLEFSFVPVPANPYALSMRQVQELGLDLSMLNTKGLTLKTDDEATPPADPAPETPAEDPKPEDTTPPADPTPEVPPADPAPETPAPETPAPEGEQKSNKKSAEEAIAILTGLQATINDAITLALASLTTETDEEKTIKDNDAVGPEGTEGAAGKEDLETDPPQTRSNTEGLGDKAVMEAWLSQRAILRAIATATTDALTDVNDRIRKNRV
jgi:outer membrane biosynthesis protein TonB